ncbi:unnamed protein product [Cunninghamella blakesleeana]
MILQKIEETRTECVEKVQVDSTSSITPHVPVIKSEAEKKFIKKLNWTILPLSWAIVFIQYADKSALAKAAVMGMLIDTHTSPSQYSFLGSVFYISYIVYQIPNSYLIQRLPTRRYLGTILILCGICTLGTAFCVNYEQLLVCRALLGLFEAGVFPCLLMIFSSLYRRQEQTSFFGFIWLSNVTGTIFAVIVTVAIIKTLDGVHGIGLWRWNYIILGITTIVIVDHPHAKLLRLTEEEKNIVEERTQDNAVVKDKTVKVHHYWEALREPRYYLIMISATANTVPTGGLVIFNTPFIKSLGFDVLNSIVLNIPNSVMAILFTLMAIFLHRKTGRFSVPIITCGMISMTGCILLIVLPHNGIKLLGYYLVAANGGFYVVLLTIVASNVSGYSKKIFYNSSLMIAFTLGNFIGPLVMRANEAPIYRTGMATFAISNLVVVICALSSLYLMYCSNKKRLATGITKTDAYLDLTDREDANFIYKL